jgi:hypothetical protein
MSRTCEQGKLDIKIGRSSKVLEKKKDHVVL